jgi:hypothetical protein
MLGLFRQGAFQGDTPSEAFQVQCDSQTTTQDDINNGIVNIIHRGRSRSRHREFYHSFRGAGEGGCGCPQNPLRRRTGLLENRRANQPWRHSRSTVDRCSGRCAPKFPFFQSGASSPQVFGLPSYCGARYCGATPGKPAPGCSTLARRRTADRGGPFLDAGQQSSAAARMN